MSDPKVTAPKDHEQKMNRRAFIGAGSGTLLALAAMRAGAQDIAAVAKAQKGNDASDIGPKNTDLDALNPDSYMAPPTDRGDPQQFWASFSTSHRRVQPGGWTRQVTAQDFPISKDIAGVNMRLISGGIRELHWHNAGEWGLVLKGTLRLTAIDNTGRAFVDDIGENDLWFFPTGVPHSIQGLPPDGSEFLLVFDDGQFSEDGTTLISDWLRHTPPEVLAKNWSVTEQDLKPIYEVPDGGKFIFNGTTPRSLEEDQQAAYGKLGKSPVKFSFPMHSMKPDIQNKMGEIRIVDTRKFPVTNGGTANTVAAAQVVVKPGGLRELHWHQNADEWQYYIQGKGRMTVFYNAAHARTADFNAGDVGYVLKTLPHYIENTGNTDLIFLEMFKAPLFEDLSLSQWVSHIPPTLLKDHIGVSKDDLLAKIPETKQGIVG